MFTLNFNTSLHSITSTLLASSWAHVCSLCWSVSSFVERLLGFGADVFLRVPAPYELLQPAIPPESDKRLCGSKHRHIRIGAKTHLVVGVNAYDLACIFGHAPVAVALLTHM
ncbi:hypothetical protein AHF37_08442 [Paragonimus kellicotti]|nr:hypothetical protein AHF37_08442 [Paragonimus kellicotti]